MPGLSRIEWTDLTWNVWTGCNQVSPGCAHCYAKEIAENRFRNHFPNGFALTYHWERLYWPLTIRKPSRIFVNSMTDMFLEAVPIEYIQRTFDVMVQANAHYWISQSTYAQGACGVLSATNDYGYDVETVQKAFADVGVDTSSCVPPAISKKG